MNPYLEKALRLRRLMNYDKYNKEDHLFKIYLENYSEFDKIKPELIRLEMEIQQERDVSVWQTMFELITDSHAAALFTQTY